MSDIKNLFLHGGIDKEEFKSIRSDIAQANRTSLIEYCAIAFSGMALMLVLSFFVPVLASSRTSYIIFVIVSGAIYSIAKWTDAKREAMVAICIYLFETALLVFGIVLGTLVEPNQASVSFAILMFAVPLLFTDIPIITSTGLILSIVIYTVAAKWTQSSVMFDFNMSVIIPYGIVAIIICTIIMRVKISRLLLNHNNKIFSERDQLTGLFNRRCYELKLAEIEKGHFKKEVVFFEFDINGLKETNDTKGHAAGDELILAFSRLMNEVLSPYGDCYRTGGDEFFAILDHGNSEINDLVNSMHQGRKKYNKTHEVPISFAVGATKYTKGQNLEEALQETDRLMYESKQMHYFKRNNSSSRTIDWDAKNNFESNFDAAIEKKEFKVYLQPKYNAVSGVMTAAEALVRWKKEDGTMIPPGDFIPVFENSSQVIALDKYMLTSVCEMQKGFLDAGITPLPISVNISRVTLFNLGIVDALEKIINSYELPKNLVPLEITESAAFDSSHFTGIIKRLKDIGFSIHMDDFGHGYSSLNNLRLLPLDVVKLDKSLVDDIGNDNCDETLKHMIELSHFFGIEIVAEGVENEAQYNFLRKISCDTIQGYYFSRPVDADEYRVRLEESLDHQPISEEKVRKIADEASISSLKVTNDLKLRYLQAMSSIYMTVHVINLVENTTTEFATTTNVREHAHTANNADKQMQAVMQNVVSPEYVSRVLRFVDFTDLPSRMKGKRTISMDFVGVHFGWTRARFITVETNDEDEPVIVIFTTQVVEADKKDNEDKISVCITDEDTGVFNKEAFYRDGHIVDSDECLVGTDPDTLIVGAFSIAGRDKIVSESGAPAWDEVVKGAAIIINNAVGSSGRVYRVSDNEFIALVYADPDAYDTILDGILEDCRDWLSASVKGIALSQGHAGKIELPSHSVDSLVDVARSRM